MSLINYLPTFLQNILEYKEIMNVEDIEISDIKAEIENSINEVSIQNATEKGIARYEKILNMKTISELSLENRRVLVKSKFLNRAPFTVKWLDNKLKSLCGEGNYEINIDYKNFILNIQIGYLFEEATEEIRKDLKNIVPANLKLNMNFWYVENIQQKQIIATHQAECLTIEQIN